MRDGADTHRPFTESLDEYSANSNFINRQNKVTDDNRPTTRVREAKFSGAAVLHTCVLLRRTQLCNYVVVGANTRRAGYSPQVCVYVA